MIPISGGGSSCSADTTPVVVFLTQHRATAEQRAHFATLGARTVCLPDLIESGQLSGVSCSFRHAEHAADVLRACLDVSGGYLAAVVVVMPAWMMARFLPMMQQWPGGPVPVLKALMDPVFLGDERRGRAPQFRWRGRYLEIVDVAQDSGPFELSALRPGVVAYPGSHLPDPRVRELLEAQGLTVRCLKELVDARELPESLLFFRRGEDCYDAACALLRPGESLSAVVPVLPFQKMEALLRVSRVPVLQFGMRPVRRGVADDGHSSLYAWTGEIRQIHAQSVRLVEWEPRSWSPRSVPPGPVRDAPSA